MENVEFKYHFSFICSLFQKDLYKEVQANYDIISDYFMKGDMNHKNEINVGILNYIHKTKVNEFDVDNFYKYLMTDLKLINEEALPLTEMAAEAYSGGDKSKYVEASSKLRDIANSVISERAFADAGGSPTKYVESIKKFEYVSSFSDKINVLYLDDLTPVEIMEQYLTSDKVLTSAYPVINESSHLGGWPPGQIIMVTSPPGGGKTLYMMREAAHMARSGHKCVYVALADMNISDFYIRMYAVEKEIPFYQATVEFAKAYEYGAELKKNLGVIIEEADKISVNDVVDYIITNLPDTEAVFLDYDSQFLIDKDDSGGNMYEYAVRPYISASRFKKLGITTFIGSQPRTAYYGQEYLDMNAAGESSKKQQCVDFIISIGTNDETGVPCGYFAMPKARRFFNKFKVPYVRTVDGKMHLKVPYQVYAELRPKITDPDLTSEKLRMIMAQSGRGEAVVTSGMTVNTKSTVIDTPPPAMPDNPLLKLSSIAPTSADLPSLPK